MVITADECKKQLDKYSVEFPDPIMMVYYIEKANALNLTYPDNTNKALRISYVCFMVLYSGVREITARGADGASQTFKQKDALKQLRKFIKQLDKDNIIDDLPSISSGFLFTVSGATKYECN